MRYDLRRPCPHCPFRTDGDGYLRPERAQEIALDILRGAEFACHQTTADSDNDDGSGDRVATSNSQFCAGALIMLESEERPNQSMRIAERLGLYDAGKLDMDAPIGYVMDFINRHDDGGDEPECCSVCDAGCLSPAGYLENGVAVRVTPEDEVAHCDECGEPVCDNCGEAARGRFCCPECAEYDRSTLSA